MGICHCEEQKLKCISDFYLGIVGNTEKRGELKMFRSGKTLAMTSSHKLYTKLKTIGKYNKACSHYSTETLLEHNRNLMSYKKMATQYCPHGTRGSGFFSPLSKRGSNILPKLTFKINGVNQSNKSFFDEASRVKDKDISGFDSSLIGASSNLSENYSFHEQSANIVGEFNSLIEVSSLQISQEEEKNYLNNIRKHFLFKNFSEKMFDFLLSRVDGIEIEEGSCIYKEGDEGNRLFIIKKGEVELSSKESNVILTSGDIFGELALLQINIKRNETATAITTVTILTIDGEDYRQAEKQFRNVTISQIQKCLDTNIFFSALNPCQKFGISIAVDIKVFNKDEIIDASDKIVIIDKGKILAKSEGEETIYTDGSSFGEISVIIGLKLNEFEEVKTLEPTNCIFLTRDILLNILGDKFAELILGNVFDKAIHQNSYFNNIFLLSHLDKLYEIFQLKMYSKGEIVFETSTKLNKKAILMLKGELDVPKEYKDLFNFGLYHIKKSQYQLGRIYGDEIINMEEDLKYPIRAKRTITALEASWKKIRDTLLQISKESASLDVFKKAKLLAKTHIFRFLPESRLIELSSHLHDIKTFSTNDILICKDDEVNYLFIIVKGTVRILDGRTILRDLDEGSSFGELMILNEINSPFTYKAIKETQCYMISKNIFIEYSSDEKINDYLKQKICLEDIGVDLDDLYLISHLGKGKFGNVSLVHNHISLYAIKAVNLTFTRHDTALGQCLLNEKNILRSLDSPFIVKLVKTFKNRSTCFLLEEFINGKSLEEYMNSRGKNPFSINEIKFFAASFIYVCNYLNKRMICHRDIKASNIMVNYDGYLKFIDFGSSKVIKDFTYTVAGTPLFLAPEVLLGKGYSFPSDYWSIGIVLYFMLYGEYPYKHINNIVNLYREIVQDKIQFPKKEGGCWMLQNFLVQLLNKSPVDRLCSLPRVQEDRFFMNFNWHDLETLQMPKEYLPSGSAKYDKGVINSSLKNTSIKYTTHLMRKNIPNAFTLLGNSNFNEEQGRLVAIKKSETILGNAYTMWLNEF